MFVEDLSMNSSLFLGKSRKPASGKGYSPNLDTVRLVVTAYSPNIYRRSVRCLSPEESLRGTVRVPLNNSKSNQNHNTAIIKISDYGQI